MHLALGLAGAIALPGGFKWLVGFIQAHWLDPGIWADLPPVTVAFTSLAITLGLPASIFLLLFVAIGLQRRVHAPRERRTTVGLAVAWIVYVAWILVANVILAEEYRQAGDAAWAVAMLVSMGVAPFFIAAIIWGLFSGWREIRALLRVGPGESDPWKKLLPWVVVLPLAPAMPLFWTQRDLLRDPRPRRASSTGSAKASAFDCSPNQAAKYGPWPTTGIRKS